MLGRKRARVSLLAASSAAVVAVLVAGCGGGGGTKKSYPPDVQANFLSACLQQPDSDAALCGCFLAQIQERIDYERFARIDTAVVTGLGLSDDERNTVLDALGACRDGKGSSALEDYGGSGFVLPETTTESADAGPATEAEMTAAERAPIIAQRVRDAGYTVTPVEPPADAEPPRQIRKVIVGRTEVRMQFFETADDAFTVAAELSPVLKQAGMLAVRVGPNIYTATGIAMLDVPDPDVLDRVVHAAESDASNVYPIG
jgi:hypothetical protein